LELAFRTRALRTLCEHEEVAERKLGTSLADALRARLADLRAVSCIDEVPTGQPRRLPGGSQHLMALTLVRGYRLVFRPNHNETPLLESGNVDWTRVTRIKLLRIEKER
jgi:hypothetical protein